MSGFAEAHRETLARAARALAERTYWSAYPEMPSPKVYGETAKAEAQAAFQALRDRPFETGQAAETWLGAEVSPYGFPLGVTYPAASAATLVARAEATLDAWGGASADEKAGVCLEILSRLNKSSFLIAEAVQHTSGQAPMMAFQAGGPHAQDRGLEAVAAAHAEMTRLPAAVTWEKPQGKGEPLVVEKAYHLVPRGVAVTIGCATFPTWNAYPGFFASLATGNPVIVKPHPGAILPLAVTVRIAREVLAEAGFPADVVQLAPDLPERPITKDLVLHPGVKIVDFTGSPAFGSWLRANAGDRLVYTEEAGVNAIVVDSTADFRAMCANVGFSLSLYTGQMCTAPQAIFVPADGIDTPDGRKSFDEVATGIATAIDKLLGDPDRAAAVLGAVQSEATLARVGAARALGRVVRESAAVAIPGYEKARAVTPLLIASTAVDREAWGAERFGPISFVVATEGTAQSIALAAATAREKGAITASLYSTDEGVVARAAAAFGRAGVPLSVNLLGGLFVNQSAAFSDFHVTGANPAGNASLTDTAFVANRFRVATVRRQKAA